MNSSFVKLLNRLVKEQQIQVDEENRKTRILKDIDYLAQIRILYQNGKFRLADDIKLLDDDLHDGVKYKDKLCLRKDQLKRFFPSANISTVIRSLLEQGVLAAGSTTSGKQLGATAKYKNPQFIAILLAYLD